MEPMKMGEFEPPEGPRRAQGMPWWPAAAVVFVLAALVVWFLWSRSRDTRLPTAEPPAPVASEAVDEPVEAAPAPDEWELPSLAESDDFLRDVASRLSSHPAWLSWIATDDLVQRFVAGVDEVARGEVPTAQARFLAPKKGFYPRSTQGKQYVDPASYERYDRLAAVVSGLDAQGVASLYERLEPLFERAYRDLGYPQGNFDAVLAKAIQEVLDAPEVERSLELVEAPLSYRFADPKLEALPPAQKLMLRMGPDNAATVKRKLREIAAALDRLQVAGERAETADRAR